jgi:hypothetical protein
MEIILQSPDGNSVSGVGIRRAHHRRKFPRRAETAGGGGGASPVFHEAPGKTAVGSRRGHAYPSRNIYYHLSESDSSTRIGDANLQKKRNLPIFMEFAGKPKPPATSYWRIVRKGYGLFFRNRPQKGEYSFPVKSSGGGGNGRKRFRNFFLDTLKQSHNTTNPIG